MRIRKAGVRLAMFAALFTALVALTATTALAGPSDPTLDVTQLQAAIDANGGTLPGYLKTVIKGKDIVEVDVSVRAIVTGFGTGPADMNSLIYFHSDDPIIMDNGGIAAGMSGSPIYVNVDGEDKLVGALSYGEPDSLLGAGFATPIEAMANVQATYSVASLPRRLSSPVIVEGQIKDRVVVAANPSALSRQPANTIIAKPLPAISLAGINPQSRLYKAYAKALESRGVELFTPRAGGLSAMTSTYSAEFQGGSAVAVLAARGDLWAGGIGTVTYVDTQTVNPTVVAFGHPAYYEGDSGLYLCNAWIDDIFPSTFMAYKLGRPAALRGTLRQDRLAGIAGVDGPKPVDIPITAKATRGSKVATSAVQIPPFVADSSSGTYWGLPTFGAYMAGSRLFDANTTPGSALTTTTVRVQDGTGPIYTLVRRNIYSSGYDIPSAVVSDVDDMVTSLQNANANGIAKGHILSVDLESEFSGTRHEATIVDLNVVDGLKSGDNTVTVSFLQYGEPDTQTVDVKLTIPEDVPVTGDLRASSANNSGDSEYYETMYMEEYFGMGFEDSGIDRRTVGDVVSELNETVDNTVMAVTFQPALLTYGPEDRPGEPSESTEEFDSIETTVATEWVISGSVMKAAPELQLYDTVTRYGRQAFIYGSLLGVDGPAIVKITGIDSIPGTTTVTDGMIRYYGEDPLYTSKAATATFAGNDYALPTQATFIVQVGARTKLSASKKSIALGSSVKLTAKVLPKTTGGYVAIQRWNGSRFSTIKKARVPSSGTVSYTAKPSKRGTNKFRARFLGSSKNYPSYSSIVIVKVK